ncbi:hypothetical protein RKE30_26820 [Streptomyces sp. Li-HN-5-11]|nr:hypothetical protein [Streptomyces sp. Li-HN-5-11]WNM33734.1 hypothetical protein RKE30_26820 [Streptomyces sp. Li-HN-5-11]
MFGVLGGESLRALLCGRAGLGVLGSHGAQQGREVRREPVGDFRWAVEAGDCRFQWGALVLQFAFQALQQDQAERVDVGGRPDPPALHLLRCQIGGGASQHVRFRVTSGIGQARDAEIGQVRITSRIEEDVRRFDVSVHDAGPVDIGQRPREGGAHTYHTPLRQRSTRQKTAQRGTLDQLHDQVRAVVVTAGVVDGDQSGVLQAGQKDGLRGESVLRLRVRAGPEDLDSHRPPKARVDALVDVGHASGPNSRAQQVATGEDFGGLLIRRSRRGRQRGC